MRALDWRKRIDFVDIYSPDAACPIDPALLLARFHAQEKAGALVSGAEAFALMWRQIPLFWPMGQMARIPLVLDAAGRAYCDFLSGATAVNRSAGRAPSRGTRSN